MGDGKARARSVAPGARVALSAVAVGVVSVSVLASGPASRAQTLDEALTSAFETNPTLSAAIEGFRSTVEDLPLAQSGFRPTVTSRLGTGVARDEIIGESFNAPVAVNNPSTQSVVVSQPLYSGGRTFAAVRQARNAIAASRAETASIEQQVLLAAAIAYVDVVQQTELVALAEQNERVLVEQREATAIQIDFGEATLTDLSQADARVAGARAQTISTRADLDAARATFERTTGMEAIDPVDPNGVTEGLPENLNEAIDIALAESPIVQSALMSEKAAQDGVDLAQGELRPSVTLDGTVENVLDPSDSAERTTNASVLVNVDIPLYQGGASRARIRAARRDASEARLLLDVARQDVVEQVTRTWRVLQGALGTFAALEAQVEAAREAMVGIRLEADVGARTVLDILDSEQELFDARAALIEAHRDVSVHRYELMTAMGRMTAAAQGLTVEGYDPDAIVADSDGRWFGTGRD